MLEGAALVTGGSLRIGAAVCRALAAAGADVVVHANRSRKQAEALAQEIGGHVVVGDLLDPLVAEGLVDAAADAAGTPIHYVVNNASMFPRQRLRDMAYDDMEAMMRLHAWAPFAIVRAAARQGGKAAVNMLDARIVSQDPLHAAYILSKRMLGDLTRSMAREFAPMRVNGVAPGATLPPVDGGDLSAAVRATVLGRTGTADEIAHAVTFMLENEYVTGDVVFVDGGRHLR